MYDLFKIKSFLVKNEWKLVLFLTGFCIFAIFLSTGSLYPGKLSKVDYTTSFGNESFWSGWSHSNFGRPISLNKSADVIRFFASLIPVFPFKDFVIYFLLPTYAVGFALFLWVAGHLRQRAVSNPNLVGSYTILFFFNSIVFLSVFLYGWNLSILLPIAGMAFACRGIDLFYSSEKSTGLLFVAIGSFLIGGMVQFLFYVLLYAFDPKRGLKKFFIVVLVVLSADAYTIVPEIFVSLLGFGHYVGIDPLNDTKSIQNSLGLLGRMSGSTDPSLVAYWNHSFWILVLLAGVLSIFSSKRLNVGTQGAKLAFALFSFFNFSGMHWEFSINKAFTFVPFVGGIFRDAFKIFVIFVIPVLLFAALWMRNHRTVRFLTILCLMLSNSQL